MADKLSVQQLSTLNTYLKKHPNAKREDAIKLLFDNSAKKPSGKGVKVEHNKSNKKQTITLKSGLSVDIAKGTSVETKEGKITLSKSGRYSVTGKDGKVRYYAANGTELNEKYFKQVESSTGNVTVKNSKGVTVDVNKRLQNRIARASKALKHEEDNQGLIGKLWSGAKNTFGFGDSSDKVQQQLKQEQKLLKQFNQQPQNRAKIFKQLTGLEYNSKNMQDFVEGKIQLKSEQKLDAYKEGQATAVDVTTDIVSGVASFAVYSAAVAAAPFTGGASIAAGVVLAGAVGAGTKVALKAGETIGTDKKYDSLGHDLVMGAANGAISTVTAGLGGAVAKSLATRMGLEVVKAGAKEVAKQGTKQVVSQATKQAAKTGFKRAFSSAMKGAKEGLINPGGYKYVAKDGVKNAGLKKFGAYMAEGATDGSLSGGAISGVETAHNGGSAEDVLKATAFGTLSGAVMGGVMNYGMNEGASAVGKLFKGKAKATTEVAADAVNFTPTPKPSLSEIDKIARAKDMNQANLSPHRFNDVSGKKAQKQVSDYLDNILSKIPENTPEASSVNNVKKYADFILPDGTLISRLYAGDTGVFAFNSVTGKHETKDIENAVLFWIKDINGQEHVLPALTPKNVSKAKKLIHYMSTQEEIPRDNINEVQKQFLKDGTYTKSWTSDSNIKSESVTRVHTNPEIIKSKNELQHYLDKSKYGQYGKLRDLLNIIDRVEPEYVNLHLENMKKCIDLNMGTSLDYIIKHGYFDSKEGAEAFKFFATKFNKLPKNLSDSMSDLQNVLKQFDSKNFKNAQRLGLLGEITPINAGKLNEIAGSSENAAVHITSPTPKAQAETSLAPSGSGLAKGADDAAPTPKAQGAVSGAISQTEHALTASELQAIQKSIKQLPFMTDIEDRPAFYNEIIQKIQAAVTKNANGDMKLIQSRISKIGDANCKQYIFRNAKNIDIILDNTKEINEIYDNICDKFFWTSDDVIMGINKDNFQEVLKASRLVKKGDQDAINYLYYVDYSRNPHTVKYGNTTVEVDTEDIIALLSTRQAYDSEKFDREISKLFSKNVDMHEKKAYGKSFAGILEQKPELLEIAEKTKNMSKKEYREYINNLFAENKLDKNLTFRTFEPDDVSVEAETAIGAYLHMRKHPELAKNIFVKETIQDTTPKAQAGNSLATGGSKSVKGADDATPTPKAQGVKESKPNADDLDDIFDGIIDESVENVAPSPAKTGGFTITPVPKKPKTEIEMLRDSIYAPKSDNSYKISTEVFSPKEIVEVLPQVKTQNELDIIKEKLRNIFSNSNPDEYEKLRSVQKLVEAKEDEFAAKCYTHMDERVDDQIAPNSDDFKRIITQQIKDADNMEELKHLQKDFNLYKGGLRDTLKKWDDVESILKQKMDFVALSGRKQKIMDAKSLKEVMTDSSDPELNKLITAKREEIITKLNIAYNEFKAGKSIPSWNEMEEIMMIKVKDCKTVEDLAQFKADINMYRNQSAIWPGEAWGVVNDKELEIRRGVLGDFIKRLKSCNTEEEFKALKKEFREYKKSDNYYTDLQKAANNARKGNYDLGFAIYDDYERVNKMFASKQETFKATKVKRVKNTDYVEHHTTSSGFTVFIPKKPNLDNVFDGLNDLSIAPKQRQKIAQLEPDLQKALVSNAEAFAKAEQKIINDSLGAGWNSGGRMPKPAIYDVKLNSSLSLNEIREIINRADFPTNEVDLEKCFDSWVIEKYKSLTMESWETYQKQLNDADEIVTMIYEKISTKSDISPEIMQKIEQKISLLSHNFQDFILGIVDKKFKTDSILKSLEQSLADGKMTKGHYYSRIEEVKTDLLLDKLNESLKSGSITEQQYVESEQEILRSSLSRVWEQSFADSRITKEQYDLLKVLDKSFDENKITKEHYDTLHKLEQSFSDGDINEEQYIAKIQEMLNNPKNSSSEFPRIVAQTIEEFDPVNDYQKVTNLEEFTIYTANLEKSLKEGKITQKEFDETYTPLLEAKAAEIMNKPTAEVPTVKENESVILSDEMLSKLDNFNPEAVPDGSNSQKLKEYEDLLDLAKEHNKINDTDYANYKMICEMLKSI